MSRSRYGDTANWASGLAIQKFPNAQVAVLVAGTSTPLLDTIWKNATGLTGADQYANPFTTGSDGRIEFYLDNPRSVKLSISGTVGGVAIGPLVVDYEPVMPDPSDILTKSASFGVRYLESFAATTGSAIRGSAPAEDPDAAWAAAFAAGPGIVQLGPYTYLPWTSAVTEVDGVIIRGCGYSATKILHRAHSSREPIHFLGRTDCGVAELWVDGNYANNTTYDSCEITIDGMRCFAYRVKVTSFNKQAITMGGIDNVVDSCVIQGLAPTPYNTWGGGVYQSLTGVTVAGQSLCRRLRVTNNLITGCRSVAIGIGGIGGLIDGNIIEDCHRGDEPQDTPGGAVAFPPTTTTINSDTPPQHFILSNNTIGPAPTRIGPSTLGGGGGFELNSCQHFVLSGNKVNDVALFGITINATAFPSYDIVIDGGSINGVDTVNAVPTSGGSVGIALYPSTTYSVKGIVVSNVAISNCRTAIWTFENSAGLLNNYRFNNLILDGNTVGWVKADAASNDGRAQGTAVVGGAGIPEQVSVAGNTSADYAAILANAHASGHGVLVKGGSSASQYALRVQNNGGGDLFYVAGDGSAAQNLNVGGGFGYTLANAHASGNGLWVKAGLSASQYALRVGNSGGSDLFFVTGSGAVNIGAASARLTADLSNATHASRMLLQSTTVNGQTQVGAIPNGSSASAGFNAYNNATPASGTVAQMLALSTEVSVRATALGGSALPLTLYTNGAQQAQIDAAGNKIMHGGAGALATTATTGFVWVPYCLGTPTGNPGAPANSSGSVPLAIDLTANKLWFWTGAAWKQSAAFT